MAIDIEKLKKENVNEFLKMNRDAGNFIKQLLYELENKEKVYIKLRDAEKDGLVVYYDMVQGDPGEVVLWAETLGFSAYDDHRLEV